jgi:hypothetical protein
METAKHVAIIRSRLETLLRELRAMPVLRHSEITAAYESMLRELVGKDSERAEWGARSITFPELRKQLTGMPGARPVLEAIDAAIADGVE